MIDRTDKPKSLTEMIDEHVKASPGRPTDIISSVVSGVLGGVIHPPVYPTIGPKAPPFPPLQVSMQPNVAPLTAQQRVIELKKKIVEYKSLLSIVTDLSTKSFALLLLGNIEKELVEIQAELGKNQVQPAPIQTPITPVVQPYYPQVPTIGSPVQPYRTGDFPSFPQDPVTFTGGDVFLTNSNEDNQ